MQKHTIKHRVDIWKPCKRGGGKRQKDQAWHKKNYRNNKPGLMVTHRDLANNQGT